MKTMARKGRPLPLPFCIVNDARRCALAAELARLANTGEFLAPK